MSILRTSMALRQLAVLVTVAAFFFLSFLALKAIQIARESARRTELRNNWGHGDPVEDTKTLMTMRANFPVEFLGDRLSYQAVADSSEDDGQILCLSADSEHLLMQYEESAQWNARRWTLSKLHDESYAEFVERAGFGNGRMWHPLQWEAVLVPEPQPISLPKSSQESEFEIFIGQEIAQSPFDPFPMFELAKLHTDGYVDFVNPSRLGVVLSFAQMSHDGSKKSPFATRQISRNWAELPVVSRSRPLSVGFIAHGMTNDLNTSNQARLAEWQISKLELVSLRKFREPRVYLSTNLPNMNELKNAKTRSIEDFEQQALEQIRDGEEIVIESHADQIRMVGAVRAAKQCLDCHTGRRGDLLGAFSYCLHRKRPNAPPSRLEGRNLEDESRMPRPSINPRRASIF